MTSLRYLFLGLLGLCLLILALANRGIVALRLLPEDLGGAIGIDPSVSMPLFLIVFLSMAVGLLIGFVWEWLREHKHRAEARSERAQKERLERELAQSRLPGEGDDVLALLERS